MKDLDHWQMDHFSSLGVADFPSPAVVAARSTEIIKQAPRGELRRFQFGERRYYVKISYFAGGKLRRFVGRSRARSEWENLGYLQSIGIPVPRRVAFAEAGGLLTVLRSGEQAMMVIEELGNTSDLQSLAQARHPLLGNFAWKNRVAARLSRHVRRMHDHGFVHWDLYWRNILVELTENPEVYLIDAPLGRRLKGAFLRRGIIKDLASIDRIARREISRTIRLGFYKSYAGIDSLARTDKKRIGRIIRFNQGRE